MQKLIQKSFSWPMYTLLRLRLKQKAPLAVDVLRTLIGQVVIYCESCIVCYTGKVETLVITLRSKITNTNP